jgi:hypothetical protein
MCRGAASDSEKGKRGQGNISSQIRDAQTSAAIGLKSH